MSNDRSQRSLMLVAMLLTPAVLADAGVAPAACSADVCVVNVTDQRLVGAPCEGHGVVKLTGDAADAARPLSASEAGKWAPLRERLSRFAPRGSR
jgi:hypothetical protein